MGSPPHSHLSPPSVLAPSTRITHPRSPPPPPPAVSDQTTHPRSPPPPPPAVFNQTTHPLSSPPPPAVSNQTTHLRSPPPPPPAVSNQTTHPLSPPPPPPILAASNRTTRSHSPSPPPPPPHRRKPPLSQSTGDMNGTVRDRSEGRQSHHVQRRKTQPTHSSADKEERRPEHSQHRPLGGHSSLHRQSFPNLSSDFFQQQQLEKQGQNSPSRSHSQ